MNLLPNETVGQRIRIAREYMSAELQRKISQTELAEKCGWGQSRIANYERDVRAPRAEEIKTISDITRVRAEWIQFGTGTMHASHEGLLAGIKRERKRWLEEKEHSNVIPGPAIQGKVPVISWVQAGGWKEAIDSVALDEEIEEWVTTTVQVREHTFGLRVQGDSMEPNFPAGIYIVVEPDIDPQPGDYVIVRNQGEATFKQLIKDGDDWYLKPLNPRYPIKPLLSPCHIIGVVREAIQRFR
ncbi:MAG: helix-turn-helix domain-containing protein [Gammaproteobacteria bacterium]|nr:helix-turn-helix domain-containing protein [Gammaproteobacteria bacterium]